MFKRSSFVLGPTGGLAYHLKALRYRKGLWHSFQTSVRAWLQDVWQTNSKELIIFGSSAGWTLDRNFIARFDQVTIVEPDHLAHALFTYRFRNSLKNRKALRIETNPNLLPWFADPVGSAVAFRNFLFNNPNASVLFANVLGQVPLLTPLLDDSVRGGANENLLQALEGRNWASYHDLFSSRVAPVRLPHRLSSTCERMSIETVSAEIYQPGAEVCDHMTLWLSQARETELAHWELEPGQHHVVGFVHS